MRLPELAAAQAQLLHAGDRVGERAIAKAVALDADRDVGDCAPSPSTRQAGDRPAAATRAEFAPAYRLAGGGTYDCRFDGFHSITRSSSALM